MLAAGALVVVALAATLIMIFAGTLGSIGFFGLTLGTFLPTVGLPILIAVIAFWYARRQTDLDRRHFYSED